MRSYRVLIWTTVVIVSSAAIGFPAVVLHRHHAAVAALEHRDSITLTTLARPESEYRLVREYDSLVSTVERADFQETVQPADMRHLQNLRGLTGVSFQNVTESAWAFLPRQLESLEFTLHTDQPNSAAWEQIVRLKHLKELSLEGGGHSADQHLSKILTLLPSLKAVRLQNLPLSPATLQAILTHKPDLESLEISNWEEGGTAGGLTDAEIELISHHHGIKELEVDGNKRLTNASFDHLAKMTSLKLLYITPPPDDSPATLAQRKLKPEGLEKLRILRPDLEINPMPIYGCFGGF